MGVVEVEAIETFFKTRTEISILAAVDDSVSVHQYGLQATSELMKVEREIERLTLEQYVSVLSMSMSPF